MIFRTENPRNRLILELMARAGMRTLQEVLEETSVLHRLGLFEKLGKRHKTTNCIESIAALVGRRTDKVGYWINSSEKQGWLVTALLDIEPRLNRIREYRDLPELRLALQMVLCITGRKILAT